MNSLDRIANGASVLDVYNYGANPKLDVLNELEPTEADLNNPEFLEFLELVQDDAENLGTAA